MSRPIRSAKRYSLYDNLQVCYEGFTKEIPIHVPDLSTQGMFITTPMCFPEGAVLRVSFLLPRTGVHLNARAEVRFCRPGCGIGLEFIKLEQDQADAIELELGSPLCTHEPIANATVESA